MTTKTYYPDGLAVHTINECLFLRQSRLREVVACIYFHVLVMFYLLLYWYYCNNWTAIWFMAIFILAWIIGAGIETGIKLFGSQCLLDGKAKTLTVCQLFRPTRTVIPFSSIRALRLSEIVKEGRYTIQIVLDYEDQSVAGTTTLAAIRLPDAIPIDLGREAIGELATKLRTMIGCGPVSPCGSNQPVVSL